MHSDYTIQGSNYSYPPREKQKQRNREFRVKFKCEDDLYNVPDEETISEYNHTTDKCQYNMTVKSIYGCPTQCGIYSNSLCGSQGLCQYDWSNNRSKCFCYYGKTGTACEMVSFFPSPPLLLYFAPCFLLFCSFSHCEFVRSVFFSHLSLSLSLSKAGGSGTEETATRKDHPDLGSVNVREIQSTIKVKDVSTGESEDKKVNVTYDLSPWHLSDNAFTLTDAKNDFKYYWNFMGEVPSHLLPAGADCINAAGPCDFAADPTCANVKKSESKGLSLFFFFLYSPSFLR